MAKVQFSDVVPPDRRSIRNIPIPQSGKRKVSSPVAPEIKPQIESVFSVPLNKTASIQNTIPQEDNMEKQKMDSAYEFYYEKDKGNAVGGRGGKKKSFILGSVAILLIASFLFGMMTIFSSASVLIVPKTQNTEVSMDISGTKEVGPENVNYEILEASKSKMVSVSATGEESVELKASGKIVIYNNFSPEPQRLIVRTRFESPEGLIYRIPESVVVPGKTTVGGASVPGSIEVTVFADESGEKYNIGKTDFTIPGFKNDSERYPNFYARSSTAMSGGFVGNRKIVVQSEKDKAMEGIDTELEDVLVKELTAKVPEGMVMLQDSVVFESRELPQKEELSNVSIGKEITAKAILLNKSELSGKIVDRYMGEYPDWQGIASFVSNFSMLKITKKPTTLGGEDKISLSISGEAKVLAEVDTELLSQKMVGTARSGANSILQEFRGISSMKVTIRPIWKKSFPNDQSKIKIEVLND